MTELPVGPVVDTRLAQRPGRVSLRGRYVHLVPIDADAHAADLFDEACGPGRDGLWTYLFAGPFADRMALHAYLTKREASSDPMCYTIVDAASGTPRGMATLMRIHDTHRVIEVGGILFGVSLQRTRGATEAMFLMARYVFDELGYRRYEWKCNALNAASRRAALRLGFTFEGIFRQHMIMKGRNRDTAWYSMLDTEWPDRRAEFQRWLAPDNFDEAGRQRSALTHATA
jgi:RimJ/RimL family protein N-acetyltransferase